MMPKQPNSFDHCSPCLFDALTPADYVGLEDEASAVRANLISLGMEGNGIDMSAEKGLNARQRLAAKGCASAIFNNECGKFSWRTSGDLQSSGILTMRKV